MAEPTQAEHLRSTGCGACDYLVKQAQPARAAHPGAPSPHAGLQAMEVNYHEVLANSPDTAVLLDLDSGMLIDANAHAAQLFGLSADELLQRSLADLCPPLQPDGQSSRALIDATIGRALQGEIRLFEAVFAHASGRQMTCELRLVELPTPNRRLMHVRIVDNTRHILDERLRAGQGKLLEMIARGAPLGETLDSLMLLIESQSVGVYCSVLLLDEDGLTVRPASGPSLAPEYMAALDGLQIGPETGSCGTAMYRREIVIVADILNDPLWAPYKDLVEPYGLRACWSTPIYLDERQVLGSFAMYYREVRSPDADDMRLIAVATHLAGIAIERTRRERELAQHREHLQDLVAARTTELTLAKERTDMANHELAAALDTLRLAQAELVRRDKLAALGALVTGISHELNTPIGNSLVVATTLADRTQRLRDSVAGGLRRSTLETYLGESDQAASLLVRNLERAAALVASFKQIAVNHANSQRRAFSLSELLAEVVPALRVAAKQRHVTVELTTEPALSMDNYPGPLSQVISNLFDNCLIHAFDDGAGGTVRIEAHARKHGVIALSIADNGAGIPAPLLARVYDPFFTTKLGSGGSGLGLHVAHNIVTGVLGGRIELESELGRGTTFTLLLPVVAPDSPAQE